MHIIASKGWNFIDQKYSHWKALMVTFANALLMITKWCQHSVCPVVLAVHNPSLNLVMSTNTEMCHAAQGTTLPHYIWLLKKE